ncbi:hypothetical protein [Xanthomonas campestris]|uniref:hypothetical protein n=1 Tax=Xanthomonas campestris TaxID=339 RepID=UPI0032E37582
MKRSLDRWMTRQVALYRIPPMRMSSRARTAVSSWPTCHDEPLAIQAWRSSAVEVAIGEL